MTEQNKVSVKISKVRGQVVIEASHTLPRTEALIELLPRKVQTYLKQQKRYHGSYEYVALTDVISRFETAVPFQVWADALSSALMTRLANEEGATSELHYLVEGGYLALGNIVYKMSAIGLASQSKALTVARRKASERAEEVSKSIIADSKMTAEALIANASRVKKDAEAFDKMIKQKYAMIPPQWAVESSLLLRYSNTRRAWEIGQPAKINITHWDIAFVREGRTCKYTWNAPDPIFGVVEQKPIKVTIWIPLQIDGTYGLSSVHTGQYDQYLPHIYEAGACMSPAGMPNKITNALELGQAMRSITLCLQRVQLNSLFTEINNWLEALKHFMPEELYKTYKAKPHWDAAKGLVHDDEAARVAREETETTWTVPR